MKKYTVTFQIQQDEETYNRLGVSSKFLEFDLKELITTAVLPTLNVELTPLTFTVKNARG